MSANAREKLSNRASVVAIAVAWKKIQIGVEAMHLLSTGNATQPNKKAERQMAKFSRAGYLGKVGEGCAPPHPSAGRVLHH